MSVLTFLIRMTLVATKSCTYKNLSWMCLVSFETPSLVAMVFAELESVWIVIVTFPSKQDSVRKFTIPSASATPEPMAYSSASPELVAIEPCVRL